MRCHVILLLLPPQHMFAPPWVAVCTAALKLSLRYDVLLWETLIKWLQGLELSTCLCGSQSAHVYILLHLAANLGVVVVYTAVCCLRPLWSLCKVSISLLSQGFPL